jgi:hypothetical protein
MTTLRNPACASISAGTRCRLVYEAVNKALSATSCRWSAFEDEFIHFFLLVPISINVILQASPGTPILVLLAALESPNYSSSLISQIHQLLESCLVLCEVYLYLEERPFQR